MLRTSPPPSSSSSSSSSSSATEAYGSSIKIRVQPTTRHKMISQRRWRIAGVIAFTLLIILLFNSVSELRNARNVDFYTSTTDALNSLHSQLDRQSSVQANIHPNSGQGDTSGNLAERLRHAETQAKQAANAKAPLKPDHPSRVNGVGSAAEGNVAGRLKYAKEEDSQKPLKAPAEEERKVEAELESILKKGPIIIFSKTYCPHSKRAKAILLDKYSIVPAPYVVELDAHELGPALQAQLARLTGRKTVPNVLINGRSIGGGDDVAALDDSGALVEKVLSMGGKRMTEVTLRSKA